MTGADQSEVRTPAPGAGRSLPVPGCGTFRVGWPGVTCCVRIADVAEVPGFGDVHAAAPCADGSDASIVGACARVALRATDAVLRTRLDDIQRPAVRSV